ncbi:MAG: hypothetical protein AAF919_15285 [Pseudomonadota bacterium]
MSDDALRAKLQLLAADADDWDGASRILMSDGGPEAVITKVLEEIDNTVLSARLTFRRGDAEIALVASGRRLQGVADASEGLPADNLKDRSIDGEDQSAIAACGDLRRAFANVSAGPVTATTAPSTRMGGDTEAGLSVRLLSEAWDLTPLDPSIPPLGHFLARLDEAVTAGMMLRGAEVVGQVGEDGHGLTLDKVFGAEADAGPTLRVWMSEADAVALAVQGQDKVALLFAPDALGDVQASWTRISSAF